MPGGIKHMIGRTVGGYTRPIGAAELKLLMV